MIHINTLLLFNYLIQFNALVVDRSTQKDIGKIKGTKGRGLG
jgi:hypothetical protein